MFSDCVNILKFMVIFAENLKVGGDKRRSGNLMLIWAG